MRKGDLGAPVSQLQRALKIEATGLFDDATETAVVAFQRKAGLVADGIVGSKTLEALAAATIPRIGPEIKRLGQRDLEAAAQRLGCTLPALMAVSEVESRGNGFLPDGRPVILFERHVLYQRLNLAGIDAAALAARYPAMISNSRGGYVGGAGEWARVAQLRHVLPAEAEGAVEESCSCGQFQIMGYHWESLGYASIEEFVAAMSRSEAAQLEAFCRFIEADPALLKALKARKWADFAKGYNGPAYKDNCYDAKLAAACARYEALHPIREAA